MAPEPTRILVVDDHDVVHWGFRLLLERQSWVESCAAATNGKDALVEAARTKPHVALVDLFLAGESGAEVAEELRRVHPDLRVLLISGAGRISPAVARAAGASGFVSKDWGAADVVRAVRMVALGQEVFIQTSEQGEAQLTAREREVVSHISRGETNAEIAEVLYLSPHTVKEYTSAIYRKLGVRNRARPSRPRSGTASSLRAVNHPPTLRAYPAERGVRAPKALTYGLGRTSIGRCASSPTQRCSSLGQGSHEEGMRDTVAECRPDLLDLAIELVGADPFEHVADGTRFAQPAIYCASLAGWEQLGRPHPAAAAGHSLGELAALAAAGALDHADGLRLAARRGELMQEAAERGGGGMLAVLGSPELAVEVARTTA